MEKDTNTTASEGGQEALRQLRTERDEQQRNAVNARRAQQTARHAAERIAELGYNKPVSADEAVDFAAQNVAGDAETPTQRAYREEQARQARIAAEEAEAQRRAEEARANAEKRAANQHHAVRGEANAAYRQTYGRKQ